MALQLVHSNIGRKLDVILGGGYREFLPINSNDPLGRRGRRTDNRDLIKEWMFSHRRSFFVHDRVKMTQISHVNDKSSAVFHRQVSTLFNTDISTSFSGCSAKATCNIICLMIRLSSLLCWKCHTKRCRWFRKILKVMFS